MISYNMTDIEYHTRPELSSTSARQLLPEFGGSPEKYRWRQDNPVETTTPAFDLGKAVHAAILGVGAKGIPYPQDVLDGRGYATTKAAKEWAAQTRANGNVPMKTEDLEPIQGMREAALAHPEARTILETMQNREISIFADVDNIASRARLDLYNTTEGTAADLKTTTDASPIGFNRTIAKYHYEFQAVWYSEVHKAATGQPLERFEFVAVETKAPFAVAVYELDDAYKQYGHKMTQQARDIYNQCVITDTWPGYTSGILYAPTRIAWELEDQETEITF